MRKLRLLMLLLIGGFYSLAFSQYLLTNNVSAAPLDCAGRAYMVRSVQAGNGFNYSEIYESRESGTAGVSLQLCSRAQLA